MPAKEKWYEIKAQAAGRAQVYIFGVIVDYKWAEDDVSAKEFIDAIKPLGDFDLRINSPGGSVWAGNAIYNAVRRHPGQVDVYIEGLAASIASVIAMAGRRVHMPQNAMLMIHDPWIIAAGPATELRRAAEMLDKSALGLVAAYQEKTGLEPDQIRQMMNAETWITAAEAVALGFADDIEEQVPLAAQFDLTRYRNVPRALINPLPPKAEAHPAHGGNSMDMEKLKKDQPELLAKIEANARVGHLAQAEHEAAVAAARQEVMDLHAALFGEEAAARFSAVVSAGVTASQAKALGVSLAPTASDSQASSGDAASRQAILAGLSAVAPAPVNGAAATPDAAAERTALAKTIAAGGSIQ